MCGIIAYIGKERALPILMEGLQSLEYRGYDSAGVALFNQDKLSVYRCKGKVAHLKSVLPSSLGGKVGIGHTRWATHGEPSQENAHPQLDCSDTLAVVHNGIIENYLSLKLALEEEGHIFHSKTDTEVIPHLIEKYIAQGYPFEEAVERALLELKGSYALAIISQTQPSKLIGVRNKSPLIIGVSEGGFFLTSDIPALLKYTTEVVLLEDREIALLSSSEFQVKKVNGPFLKKERKKVSWNRQQVLKGEFEHFMLKEIHEQPQAIIETLKGRILEEEATVHFEEGVSIPQKTKRILLLGCGTSWHAALVGKYLLEALANLPAEVDYAAEFRYREPLLINPEVLTIAISQSGETADTVEAARAVRRKETPLLAICNVLGSALTREANGVIYTRAGPEIGVASTKAFTTQLVILYLLGIYLGQRQGIISSSQAKELFKELKDIPRKVTQILKSQSEKLQQIAEKYYSKTNFLFLARGIGYPIALEGALKLKEISYIHAEGYPAAEMKHGPIALIDENMPVVVLAHKGRRYPKILANIEEIRAREGKLIVVTTEGASELEEITSDIIYIPQTLPLLTPILGVIPLQLLAYYIAKRRGCPIDQPRNLAKSVTVE
jgi:glucosamine--fructose-6-phosphate aminotransferase (isomerizing)